MDWRCDSSQAQSLEFKPQSYREKKVQGAGKTSWKRGALELVRGWREGGESGRFLSREKVLDKLTKQNQLWALTTLLRDQGSSLDPNP
jgi:hypothetical protein